MERSLLNAEAAAWEAGAGGLEDFDSLVRLHRPRIFRFLLASLRDRETAENLTQDCFIRAFQGRNRFRGEASVATWLMQIAANLVRDHRGSSRLKFWRRTVDTGVDMGALSDWIPDQHGSPEVQSMAREQVEAVWTGVADLSERQRTVFLLRFVEDMDILEIAAATNMKEGTVKTHLFRAVEAVRRKLEKRK
jgi:RNA polymerase sigma-70 factor (ECF subfamily)